MHYDIAEAANQRIAANTEDAMTEKLREHIAKELLDVISLKGTPDVIADVERNLLALRKDRHLFGGDFD